MDAAVRAMVAWELGRGAEPSVTGRNLRLTNGPDVQIIRCRDTDEAVQLLRDARTTLGRLSDVRRNGPLPQRLAARLMLRLVRT